MQIVRNPMVAAAATALAVLMGSCSTGDPVNETAGTAFAPTTAASADDDGGFAVEAQARETETIVVGEPTDLAEFCDRTEAAYELAGADPVDPDAYGAALAYAQEAIPESVAGHINKHFDSVIDVANTYDDLPTDSAPEDVAPDEGVAADELPEAEPTDPETTDTTSAEDAPTELSAQDRLRTASAPLGETVLGGMCGRDYTPL